MGFKPPFFILFSFGQLSSQNTTGDTFMQMIVSPVLVGVNNPLFFSHAFFDSTLTTSNIYLTINTLRVTPWL